MFRQLIWTFIRFSYFESKFVSNNSITQLKHLIYQYIGSIESDKANQKTWEESIIVLK